jgi:hypothetical protein
MTQVAPDRFRIDPNEKLDYVFDFSTLLVASETVSSQTCTASTGITITTPSPAITGGNLVTFWVNAAVAGTTPTVTCRATTSAGRIYDRTITFDVIEH